MSDTLDFYQDLLHPCPYLPDRSAQNIYPDPNKSMTQAMYSHLIQFGFRRSGDNVYRPFCPQCTSCIPVRINVQQFSLSKSQKRCLKRNKDLTVTSHPATFNDQHYQLYRRYIKARHRGGGMDNPSEESYHHFLISSWAETQFLEIHNREKLVAVAVTDFIDQGLSAFYTFFDPDLSKQSLGTYCILTQLNLAHALNLSWLYLGYWIKACPKMQYKQNFSALEIYTEQGWQTINAQKTLKNK